MKTSIVNTTFTSVTEKTQIEGLQVILQCLVYPLLYMFFIIIAFISYLIHEELPRSSAVNHRITDSGQ